MKKCQSKTGSKSLFEAMLHTLAESGSAEALLQLGERYAENDDQITEIPRCMQLSEAQNCFKKAAAQGSARARLDLYMLRLGLYGDQFDPSLSHEEASEIISDLLKIFHEGRIGGTLTSSMADKAWGIYRDLYLRDQPGYSYVPKPVPQSEPEGRFFCDADLAVAKEGALSGCLDNEDMDSCARLLLKKLQGCYKRLPERYFFLRKYVHEPEDIDYPDIMTPAMTIHELGVAYESGVSGFIEPDVSCAVRLYAEALLEFNWEDPEILYDGSAGADNDEDDSDDWPGDDQDEPAAACAGDEESCAPKKLAEYLIIVNSLATAVMRKKQTMGFQNAYDNFIDLRARAGSEILKLWKKDPKDPDIKRLLKVLMFMAEHGNFNAADVLIDFVRDGRMTARDEKLVNRLLEIQGKLGVNPAQLELAQRLASGIGVSKNPAAAQKWYLKAAEVWYDDAMAALFGYYKERAEKGNQQALLRYAHCLEHGLGCAKDPVKAAECYRKVRPLPLRYARLAQLSARAGKKDEARKLFKQAHLEVISNKDDWRSYLDACNSECGITRKPNAKNANQEFLGLIDCDIWKFTDIPDRVNRTSVSKHRNDPRHHDPDPISEVRFEIDKHVADDHFKRFGSTQRWASYIVDRLGPREPDVLALRDERNLDPEDVSKASAQLAGMLPALKQYVFDCKINFENDDPEQIQQELHKTFQEGAAITLRTCTWATRVIGGLSRNDNLRFLILSKGLPEIKEPKYARFKAAAIPAGDRLQVLSVYSNKGRHLVILLHNTPAEVTSFSAGQIEQQSYALKRLRDEFDRFIELALKPDVVFSYTDVWSATEHKDLDDKYSGNLLDYFLGPDIGD